MIAFEVKDMTCDHCVGVVTKAIQRADRTAAVTIDLARHRVEIEAVAAGARELSDAIAQAGYTPAPA